MVGLDKHAVAHLVCMLIMAWYLAIIAACLADGKSVVTIKQGDLPIITAPPFEFDIAFLLGRTYGVGLAHDVTGRSWSEVSELGTLPQLIDALGVEGVLAALPQAITDRALSHPLEFLQCLDLKTIGIMCMALGYIGISLAPILLILHAMCVARLGYTKWVNIGLRIIWAIYFIAFLIFVAAGWSGYADEFVCNNPLIPVIRLSDHFDVSYALPFAIVSLVLAIVGFTLCVTMCDMDTMEVSQEKAKAMAKSTSRLAVRKDQEVLDEPEASASVA